MCSLLCPFTARGRQLTNLSSLSSWTKSTGRESDRSHRGRLYCSSSLCHSEKRQLGVCTLLILFGQLWGTSNSSSVNKKGKKEEIESKRGYPVPLLCLLSADGSWHSALVFGICCVLAHPLQECTRPTANDRLEPLWCTQAVGAKAAASQPPGSLASSCTQRCWDPLCWLMATRNMSAKRASV